MEHIYLLNISTSDQNGESDHNVPMALKHNTKGKAH